MPENKNSKAKIAANNKYVAKAYDEIKVRVPKGDKDKIKAHADSRNESVNGFINKAITEKMERDGSGDNAAVERKE
jgi:predicted HicB family RNase H-like nuclease